MATGGGGVIVNDGNEEVSEWNCTVCEYENMIKEAIVYCKECNKIFCRHCERNHDKYVRNHKVLGQEDKKSWGTTQSTILSQIDIECAYHTKQPLSLYCGYHDEVCCPLCALKNHSGNCTETVIPVSSVASSTAAEDEYIHVREDIRKRISKFSELEKDILSYQSTFLSSQDKCKGCINNFVGQLIYSIRQLQTESLAKTKDLYDEYFEKIKHDLHVCSVTKDSLISVETQLDKLHAENDIESFIKMKIYIKRLSGYNEKEESLSSRREHIMSFMINEEFLQLFKSNHSLGNTAITDKRNKGIKAFGIGKEKKQSEEDVNKKTGHPTKHENESEVTVEGDAQSVEQQLSKDYADNGKEPKRHSKLLAEIGTSTSNIPTNLHEKKLPTNEEIQKAHARYKKGLLGREHFDSMCETICSYIKETSTLIKIVRPSYTSKHINEVTFVVICIEPIGLQYDYTIKTHVAGSCSDEAKDVMYHKDGLNRQISAQESQFVKSTIDKYAKGLMKKHRNICMISSCLLKSVGYGTDKARILQKTCIVIYVDIKGYIPILEQMLPESLKVPNSDQVIPIDVRESGYESFQGANEFHENLKSGCMIRGKNCGGTLGGFIERNGIIYALTSAHTFLDDDSNFQNCLRQGKPYLYQTDMQNDQKISVYQNELRDDHKIGHIVYAAIDPGGDQVSGVDIAIIELTDKARLPVSGQFPDGCTEHAGFTIDEPMEYTSGLIYDLKTFTEQAGKSSETFKFGSATGCTKGSFVIQGACVRTMEYSDSLKFGVSLYKQYEIQSLGDPATTPFADYGDSGALVFAKHDGNRSDLRAVGMVEGGTNHKTCVVTPIWEIFNYLRIKDSSFKNFRVNRQCTFGPEIPIPSQDDCSKPVWAQNYDRDQDLAQDISRHVREIKHDVTEKLNTLEGKTDAQNTEVNDKLGRMTEKLNTLETKTNTQNREVKNELVRLTESLNTLEEKTNEQKNEVMNKLDHIISLFASKNDQ